MAVLDRATVFYATADELADWLCEWGGRYTLHALGGRIFPTPAFVTSINCEDRLALRQLVVEQDTVFLNLKQMVSDVASVNQVPKHNPDCLILHVPKQLADTLSYGAISSAATDPNSIRVWRTVLKDLFSSTEAGAWYGISTQSKQTFERHVRFSNGAAQLFLDGVRLLGGGNTAVVRLSSKKA